LGAGFAIFGNKPSYSVYKRRGWRKYTSCNKREEFFMIEDGKSKHMQEIQKNKIEENEKENKNEENTVKSEKMRFKNADQIYE
jgi:hypothetical protein